MKVPRENTLRKDGGAEDGEATILGSAILSPKPTNVVKFSLAELHTIREEAERRKNRIHRGIHEN
jgi:hypothetical protein